MEKYVWKLGSLDSKILLGPWIDSAQMCHIASSSAAFLYLAWKFKTSVAVPHAAVKRQKFDLISHVNASKICTTLLKHTILSLIWGKGIFIDSVGKWNNMMFLSWDIGKVSAHEVKSIHWVNSSAQGSCFHKLTADVGKVWWGGSFFHKLKIMQTLFTKWMAFNNHLPVDF